MDRVGSSLRAFRHSSFPPRKRRSALAMIGGSFLWVRSPYIRRHLRGAIRRRNWSQARIWMGWFR